MEKNSKTVAGDYYIGLDIGKNYVGWAVTDTSTDYNILKFKGNLMQGVRLFTEANTSEERRAYGLSRRRMHRKQTRIRFIEMLFNDEIMKKDDTFFLRMHNSFLFPEDKEVGVQGVKYTLFNDPGFTDYDYFKKYPSIYHLRKELVSSSEPHDIRLVYLAIHHIIKKRGTPLFKGLSSTEISLENTISELVSFLELNYGISVTINKLAEKVLSDTNMSITDKKKSLYILISSENDTKKSSNSKYIADLLSGASTDLSKLFNNEDYKGIKLKLSDFSEDNYDELYSSIGDDIELIEKIKLVYDAAHLTAILGNNQYICEAKVNLYDKNKKDLKALKSFVKEYYPEKYKEIFSIKKDKLNNYAAYIGDKTNYHCSQQDFCKYLRTILSSMKEHADFYSMWKEISEDVFLTKLSGINNKMIPTQIYRKELVKILENASKYLDFFNISDEYGSVSDKILATFDFNIPYYVGPLNTHSHTAWVERTNEPITPWNIQDVVNYEISAAKFMDKLIGRCEYTMEPVLPKNSLIYSEFMVLNEINNIKVNGMPIDVDTKNNIFTDLFLNKNKKITKKIIKKYLLDRGLIAEHDIITGMHDAIGSNMKSYHDFKQLITKFNDTDMIENIIQAILVYSSDKKLLKSWLRNNYPILSDEDIKYICRKEYHDWGKYSKQFLTEIYSPDDNGEAFNILQCLKNTNCTLNQLLGTGYLFDKQLEEYRKEHFSVQKSLRDSIDEMNVSPETKKSVRQTVRIVNELSDIMNSAPKKIFIEAQNKRRYDNYSIWNRKNILLKKYDDCGKKDSELYRLLLDTSEYKLRNTAVFLYFMQLGKCMYTGENINFDYVMDPEYYNIDHIYPKSMVSDYSLNNKVLVSTVSNNEKGYTYPINSKIRESMIDFWSALKSKDFISEKKYYRLICERELNEDELLDLRSVAIPHSIKEISVLLKEIFSEANTKIVYSTADNVSDFMNRYKLRQCKHINDIYHAKNAYLNIVVGNIYNSQYVHTVANPSRIFLNDIPETWISEKTNSGKEASIVSIEKNYNKNSTRFTRLPVEVTGQISNATILPAGNGTLPIKENLPIEKYGAYTGIMSSYFCLVEHTIRAKRRVRSIMPVYMYKKRHYENNPIEYCVNDLNLIDPVIIEKKILKGTLIELDGVRYHISGRGENIIQATHDYQFIAPIEIMVYIKEIMSYIDACKFLNKELDAALYKIGKNNIQITVENNINLYDWFLYKMSSKPYESILNAVKRAVEHGRDHFISLSIFEQCKVLAEILKSFKCDSQCSDLSKIGEAGKCGQIRFNKIITSFSSVYIIHQSVTGLYEKKVDLLRETSQKNYNNHI